MLQVTPDETILIIRALRENKNPACLLRNFGVAYPLADESKIMKTFETMPMVEMSKYADLVTQAAGTIPEFYESNFKITVTRQEWINMPKNPCLLGNVAFMAFFGPPEHRHEFYDMIQDWKWFVSIYNIFTNVLTVGVVSAVVWFLFK